MTLQQTRRHTLAKLAAAVAALATAGTVTSASAHEHDDDGYQTGMVFTSSNAASGNQLLVYARSKRGTLSLLTRVDTGGLGSGAGLGSQGAVTLSSNGRYLHVVNAGSDSVSTFELRPHELRLKSVVPSGGQHPISVAESDGTVFVLNDLGLGNVVGFSNVRGQLKPLAGARGNLSVAGGAGAAQVGLNAHGDTLVVTEKNTNRLSSFTVGDDGRLGAPVVTASPGLTPFGFAFTRRNTLVVSEAVGGAAGASTVSSYQVSRKAAGTPVVVSPAVADSQSAACWVAVTPNGRWAFISNTGSSTVSSYSIAPGGAISLVQATAGQTGVGSSPADSAISPEGDRLYVRNGRTATIAAYVIGADGSLTATPFAAGLPATAVGLAAN